MLEIKFHIIQIIRILFFMKQIDILKIMAEVNI